MSESVLPYLLHKPPMVLIDDLVYSDDEKAIAKLHIRETLMFCEDKGLPTWASIEVMAQTISLYAGTQAAKQGLSPKIGFLLGTRKLQLPFSHFALDSTLTVHAHKHYIHDNLGVFECQIMLNDEKTPCISATLSVYEPNDDFMQMQESKAKETQLKKK